MRKNTLLNVRGWMSGVVFATLVLVPLSCAHGQNAHAATTIPDARTGIDSVSVRLRYASEKAPIKIVLAAPGSIRGAQGAVTLPAGAYSLSLAQVRPARQQWHVFPKTFDPSQNVEREAYLGAWRVQGYDPQIVPFGRNFRGTNGRGAFNRVDWISLKTFATLQEANALKKRLEGQRVFAWVRPETIAPGQGTVVVTDAGGREVARVPVPASITSQGLIQAAAINSGYWSERRSDRAYPGPIEIAVGTDSAMELYGEEPLETYLKGVLPAEMPASWPEEALKAQAVAARSEILASLAGKHKLEGFDFCTLEHCRAYQGHAGHNIATNHAVAATHGEVLTRSEKAIPTTYSSNCGGWTESNENVWSGPAHPALRGIPDMAVTSRPSAPSVEKQGLTAFLSGHGFAYCAGDKANFRWSRTMTRSEFDALINKSYRVGHVTRVDAVSRGVSGRLKALKVSGTEGTATIEKELEIRRAFGGLPSALFTVTIDGIYDRVQIKGAGRGHGVGLCQHGARGMALAGSNYRDIALQYFAGAALVKLQ